MQQAEEFHDMHREITAFEVLFDKIDPMIEEVLPANLSVYSHQQRGDAAAMGGFMPEGCVPCDIVVLQHTSIIRYKDDNMLYKLKGDYSVQNLFPAKTILRALLYTSKEDQIVLGIYDSVYLDGENIAALSMLARHQKLLPFFSADFPATVQYHWIGNIFKIPSDEVRRHANNMPFSCSKFFSVEDPE